MAVFAFAAGALGERLPQARITCGNEREVAGMTDGCMNLTPAKETIQSGLQGSFPHSFPTNNQQGQNWMVVGDSRAPCQCKKPLGLYLVGRLLDSFPSFWFVLVCFDLFSGFAYSCVSPWICLLAKFSDILDRGALKSI